jgi:GAF domain-containing protein
MNQLPPIEVDFVQLHRQLSAELAQAQSLDAGVSSCLALIDSYFSPQSCQLAWGADRTAYPLGPRSEAPLHQPSAAELALLWQGELALCTAAGHVAAAFAPLRARGVLLGWIFIEKPIWGADSPALLTALAVQAGPVLALLEAASRQDERVTQLHTLNEIGRLLSGVLDLDSLLEAIYVTTQRVVDAPMFYIAFYDSESDKFQLAYMGREGRRQLTNETWPSHVGLAGLIARDRQPICTDDYDEECRRRGLPPRPFEGLPHARAWLGVPLVAHDRLIGVMTINTLRAGYTYSAEHIELMTTIAAQAAVAIENARLYQRSAHQARQLATLNRIGRTITSSLDPERVPSLIISQVTELLDVEESSLLLTDDATGELVFAYTTGPIGARLLGQRLPRGTGLAGYVVETGQSVIVNDVQRDDRFYSSTDESTGFVTRTLLAVPLRGVGGVGGVIEVLNRRDGGMFTAEDQQLLEAMADQAVIAIENARKFAQVDQALARRAQELVRTNDRMQHNLRSLTALNALGMAINSTLRSADEIFGMTARGVVEITDASSACVLLAEGERLRPAVQIGATLPLTGEITALLWHVIGTGRPDMWVADGALRLPEIAGRALFVVPLRATQKTLGCLCVVYDDVAPDAPDQETVVLFATQAAVAVESKELFTAVRTGRDQMASILASTREGIMLIKPDAHVAIANVALHQLCGMAAQVRQNTSIEQFLVAWEEAIRYPADEWVALRQGLDIVMSGRASFASGELNELSAHPRSVEWTVLKALSSGDSGGGSLLVLRDITEAKESERLRQDLTNMIVHDLRSPLSSVMASIDLLVRGVTGDLNGNQRGVLNIAYSSATQMLEMIGTRHQPAGVGPDAAGGRELRGVPVDRSRGRAAGVARERAEHGDSAGRPRRSAACERRRRADRAGGAESAGERAQVQRAWQHSADPGVCRLERWGHDAGEGCDNRPLRRSTARTVTGRLCDDRY